ncbi:hypothetical protein ACU8V7_21155 [Zobellia nedashkovskayae]
MSNTNIPFQSINWSKIPKTNIRMKLEWPIGKSQGKVLGKILKVAIQPIKLWE